MSPACHPALSTADLVAKTRRARRRRHLGYLKRTARVWLRIILPLFVLVTCGASFLVPCGVYGSYGKCRARQSEARTNLKRLYVAEETFFGEHDRYGDLDEIGFEPAGSVRRYRYAVALRADGFFAVAEAHEPPALAGDLWRIDDNAALSNLVDACARE